MIILMYMQYHHHGDFGVAYRSTDYSIFPFNVSTDILLFVSTDPLSHTDWQCTTKLHSPCCPHWECNLHCIHFGCRSLLAVIRGYHLGQRLPPNLNGYSLSSESRLSSTVQCGWSAVTAAQSKPHSPSAGVAMTFYRSWPRKQFYLKPTECLSESRGECV